jgi:hypothetical protein
MLQKLKKKNKNGCNMFTEKKWGGGNHRMYVCMYIRKVSIFY